MYIYIRLLLCKEDFDMLVICPSYVFDMVLRLLDQYLAPFQLASGREPRYLPMPKPFGFHAQRPADVHELLQACVKEPRSAAGALVHRKEAV